MQEDIRDIQSRMQAGRFANEQSISQGIVLRLLSQLGWPIYDTSVVIPEYSLGGRRVDFALCHPPNKPIVFIEVKQPGETGTAERQLFEYAFHMGVPMVVLTTGQEWHFYLPAERGDYGERRVYGLDLIQRDTQESEHILRRYLAYAEVSSGVAIENARHDYQNVARTREVRRSIPDAWQALLSEPDELLVELLSDKTEAICGFRPDLDVVVSFLRRVTGLPPRETVPAPVTPPIANQRSAAHSIPTRENDFAPAPRPAVLRSGPRGGTSIRGVTLFGTHYETRNGRDALQLVLKMLASKDDSFFETFTAIPKPGKRPYIARTPAELHPGRQDLADFVREVSPGSGWWMDVNLSTDAMTRVMKFACQAAGIRFGTDLSIEIR